MGGCGQVEIIRIKAVLNSTGLAHWTGTELGKNNGFSIQGSDPHTKNDLCVMKRALYHVGHLALARLFL